MTLTRKRAMPRTWKCGACQVRVTDPKKKSCPECKTRRGTGRRSMGARCDALWAKLIKRSACLAAGHQSWSTSSTWHHCGGAVEAAHVVPRRFRSTRWLLENGRALCHAHHFYFGGHEAAFRAWIGGDEYDRLWNIAQVRWAGDYGAILAELRKS